MHVQSTHEIGGDTREDLATTRVTPVGGYGSVTEIGDGPAAYLICRTERGRRGWGVHAADGTLLVSGWPTRARAVAYAERKLTAAAGVER
jgi:hypothetical protein